MKRGAPWRVLPRTRTLCKLLAGLVALTVIFHAASCGFFFCIRFPRALEFPHDIYHDIRDIYILAGKLPLCLHHTAIGTIERYLCCWVWESAAECLLCNSGQRDV